MYLSIAVEGCLSLSNFSIMQLSLSCWILVFKRSKVATQQQMLAHRKSPRSNAMNFLAQLLAQSCMLLHKLCTFQLFPLCYLLFFWYKLILLLQSPPRENLMWKQYTTTPLTWRFSSSILRSLKSKSFETNATYKYSKRNRSITQTHI